uniref:Uncharacterized protein n=1 Tax=Romanomermis culicivorax TaxID=13658 RepID=A0A915HGC6_ROMCU
MFEQRTRSRRVNCDSFGIIKNDGQQGIGIIKKISLNRNDDQIALHSAKIEKISRIHISKPKAANLTPNTHTFTIEAILSNNVIFLKS